MDARRSLRVLCRSENGSPEVPVAFGYGEELRPVAEVEDSWPGEGYRYFRVRTEDGARFILRRDERRDVWSLHSFRAPGAP